MAMWRNNGQLPDDDKLLARYARLTAGQWQRVAPTIRAFFKADGGHLFQGRLTDELNAVRQHSKRQSDNVKARWRKTKENGDTAVIPKTQSGNTPLPLPIPIKEVSEGKPSLVHSPRPTRFDEFWNVYPHRGGAKKGRKPAEAKYASAVRAGVSEQEIIDGAKRAKMDRRVRSGFARDPTTWLNQAGWEDEIDVAREDNNGNRNHNTGRTASSGGDRFLDEIALAARARPSSGGFGH
jgi:hypothetical protein